MAASYQVLALLALCAASAYAVTTKQDRALGQACADLINGDKGRRFIPAFVRLSFHDCVSGCDGCVDTGLVEPGFKDKPNAGLDETLASLHQIYMERKLYYFASKADFYAKCGQVAAEAGRRRAAGKTGYKQRLSSASDLKIVMRYGRRDCRGYPRERGQDFPNPREGWTGLIKWCRRVFSFDTVDCVAILGAHTLGKARKEASGYKLPWVSGEFDLDNEYYRDMLSTHQPWTQKNVASGGSEGTSEARHQFVANNYLMLNVDMCLAKDIVVDVWGKATNERADAYPDNYETIAIVEEYARNNTAWLEHFGYAFTKMIEYGNRVYDVEGGPAEIPDTYVPAEGEEEEPLEEEGAEEESLEYIINPDAPAEPEAEEGGEEPEAEEPEAEEPEAEEPEAEEPEAEEPEASGESKASKEAKAPKKPAASKEAKPTKLYAYQIAQQEKYRAKQKLIRQAARKAERQATRKAAQQ